MTSHIKLIPLVLHTTSKAAYSTVPIHNKLHNHDSIQHRFTVSSFPQSHLGGILMSFLYVMSFISVSVMRVLLPASVLFVQVSFIDIIFLLSQNALLSLQTFISLIYLSYFLLFAYAFTVLSPFI